MTALILNRKLRAVGLISTKVLNLGAQNGSRNNNFQAPEFRLFEVYYI